MDVGMRACIGVLVLLALCGIQLAAAAGTYEIVADTAIVPQDPDAWVEATSIAVDGDGTVYVTDKMENLVRMYSSEGDHLGSWGGWGVLNCPQGIALSGDGYVFVVDYFRVQKFTKTGVFVSAWGGEGEANGQFYYPGGIAVDNNGYVYVADTNNHRIQKFTSTGGFVATWGTVGSGNGDFMFPDDIGAGGDGYVYVSDRGNQRIQKLTSAGQFVSACGGNGTGNGQFYAPGGIAFDGAGYLYVTDGGNHRVQKFRTTGSYAATLDTSSPYDDASGSLPTGIAIDSNGTIQVLDDNRIKAFQVVVPEFAAHPVSGIAPLAVQFTEESTGMPSSCSWNFGDGGYSTDWNPLHTYEAPGTYTVRHNLNSPVWGIRDVVKTDLITVHAPLKAGFTAAPRAGYGTLEVKFTDTTTGDPASRHWDFGDGATSTMQHPSHTYSAPGSYTVVLTVANTVAGTKTATKTGYITVLPLENGLVRVQAEDYDEGGQGTAYRDTTPGNSGGVYRSDDVDIVAIMRGLGVAGYAVTGTAETEWTRYTVLSPGTVAADYPLTLRVATWAAFQSIGTSVNGTAGETVFLPNTNFATTYTNVNTTVRLGAGWNTVRLFYHGTAMNVDSFTIDPAGARPLVAAVPPGAALPSDTNADELYDDVNGNGRKDFADVVLYFNQMTWIGANEPVSLFDYNGNGRIDFADVVWLFNNL